MCVRPRNSGQTDRQEFADKRSGQASKQGIAQIGLGAAIAAFGLTFSCTQNSHCGRWDKLAAFEHSGFRMVDRLTRFGAFLPYIQCSSELIMFILPQASEYWMSSQTQVIAPKRHEAHFWHGEVPSFPCKCYTSSQSAGAKMEWQGAGLVEVEDAFISLQIEPRENSVNRPDQRNPCGSQFTSFRLHISLPHGIRVQSTLPHNNRFFRVLCCA